MTCKLDTVILDIIKAFDALDAFDIDVDISAENESRIPNFISESASLAAVMDSIKVFGTRLTNAEKDITSLKSVNAKLLEDNAKLIQENAGLRSALAVAKTPPPPGLAEGEGGGVGEGREGVDGRGGQGQPEGIEADLTGATTGTTTPTQTTPIGQEPDVTSRSKTQKTRLTNRQKNEVNAVRLDSALHATAQAMGQGSDLNDAIIIGKAVAEAQAHTWAQRIKKDNAILRAAGVPATAGGHAGAATSVAVGGHTGATGPAAATTKATSVAAGGHTGAAAVKKAAASYGATAGNLADNSGNRRKLSSVAPYRRGKAVASGNNTVMQRPFSMENKCMVIQGLKRITREQCMSFIKNTASKDIDVLHIEILSKTTSSWMTVAIELKEEDYNHLSNMDLWHPSIGIREYVGWRFWHKMKRPEVSTEMSKVRMSWAT